MKLAVTFTSMLKTTLLVGPTASIVIKDINPEYSDQKV